MLDSSVVDTSLDKPIEKRSWLLKGQRRSFSPAGRVLKISGLDLFKKKVIVPLADDSSGRRLIASAIGVGSFFFPRRMGFMWLSWIVTGVRKWKWIPVRFKSNSRSQNTPHDNARHCEYKQHAQQCFPNHGKSCLRHATDSLVFGLRTFDLSRCSLTSHSNYRYTLSQAYFTYVPLKYAIPILLGLAVLLWIRFLLRKRKCGSLLLPFLTTSPKF